jgi:short-subunit dehydrogenase
MFPILTTHLPLHELVHLIVRLVVDVGLLSFYLVLYPIYFIHWLLARHWMRAKEFKSVLITGASVGLGSGLAVELANPHATLFLIARTPGSLTDTQAKCEAKGARVVCFTADVGNRSEMQNVIDQAFAICTLDLVIANAGITGVRGLADTHEVVQTNLVGSMNTVLPVVDKWLKMRAQGSVGVMSSLNGHLSVATTFMAAYAATKVGLRVWGESLRAALAKYSINITVLAPGMTASRMVTTQQGQGINMITGVVSLEQGSKWMADGLRYNQAEVGYPWRWFIVTRTIGALPFWVREIFHSSFQRGDPYTSHSRAMEEITFGALKRD